MNSPIDSAREAAFHCRKEKKELKCPSRLGIYKFSCFMKILVADDDPTMRKLMGNLLHGRLGWEVTEVNNGLDAWQALDSGLTPDLCILDLMMPGMGGLELLAKLRSDDRFKRQKVMLCSIKSRRSTVEQALSLGVNLYLVKPFTAAEFVKEVRRVCQPLPATALPEPLQPLEDVLERLGIERGLYLELLSVFTNDVADLITRTAAPNNLSRSDWELRLGAIEGAGSSLGAVLLVAAATRLAVSVKAGDTTSIRANVEALGAENERLLAAVARISPR